MQAHFLKQFGINLWKWWPWVGVWWEDVKNLSGIKRQLSKFLKRKIHQGLVSPVMVLLVWEIPRLQE